MKALTAVVAVTALIAGVSAASAQNSTSTDQNAPPASINKGNLPKPESGAQTMSPARSTTGSAASSTREMTKKNATPATKNPANGN